jgi:hypothetical protein
MSRRCITCGLEARSDFGVYSVYCSKTVKAISREDRIKQNDCPDYTRMESALTMPPYPLRERTRGS